MHFKLATLTIVAVATLAAATGGSGSPSNQCNTGTLECCQDVGPADSPSITSLLGLLDINVKTVTGLVGVSCSAIIVVGAVTSPCSDQPLCCTDASFNGIVALGCTPISL